MTGRLTAAVGVAAGALGWTMWLCLTPVVASGDASTATLTAVAATYRAGAVICHQQPARSFHLGSAQVPVCARCLGLYAGGAIGAAIAAAWFVRRAGRPTPRSVSRDRVRRWVCAAAAPTAVLWAAEHLGGADVSNALRCAGAGPLGAAVGVIVIAAVVGVSVGDSAELSAIH
jgi:uncharacterized membrane protein